jgi:CelD/BcsL family acetyltransferase involved in cellulose biosynthesis
VSELPETTLGGASAADRLVVERVTAIADLERLTGAWDDLLDETSVGAQFRSAAWLLAWWHHFSEGKLLHVYTVWRGASLVGLLPTYRVQTPLGGWQIRLLGDSIVDSDYLGMVANREHATEVARSLAHTLVCAEDDLEFDGLEAGDVMLGALERAAAEVGASLSRTALAPCPFVSIHDAGEYGAWLAARPNRVGPRLAASQRWLAKQPAGHIEVLSREEDVLAAADAFWRLHHARWAAQGGSDAVYDTETAAFHTTSLRALARRGWARLYLVYVDGQPRAGLYGFELGGRFSYYQGGFDPSLRQRSLGMVALHAALQDAFERRFVEFDFLRGDETYKRLYSRTSRELVRINVASGTRGRASFTAYRTRAAARRVLRGVVPPNVVQWVRRLQRTRRRWPPSES